MIAHDHRCNGGVPGTKGFGDDQYIGNDVPMFYGPERTAAAAANEGLIRDHQDPVLVADLPNTRPVVAVGDAEFGDRHGFPDESRNGFRTFQLDRKSVV